ncbi:MAG: NAD(P)H-dependent oxidoreductase [Clostridiales bacterium]|nr:NAD(P)H-dependent oxidoreductase [Clostridiales bacterium]
MIITVINGQNHKGSTYNIAKILVDNLGENEVHEFFLPRDLNHFCTGCCSCIKDEALCPFYEEKKRIMDMVEKSDILIFTTPTYCMRTSAPMKSFIDLTFTYWMSHKPRESMFTKKAVVISTAAGAGANSAVKDVTNALFYWGVPYVKGYGKAIQATGWDQVKPELREKINKDMASLAKKLKTSKAHAGIKTRFMFSMMRMMQNKGMGAGEEERKYWQDMGWLGNARPWKAA